MSTDLRLAEFVQPDVGVISNCEQYILMLCHVEIEEKLQTDILEAD